MLFNKIIYLDILLIYIWMHVNIIIGKINYQLLKNLLSSSFLKFWNTFISRALPYNDDHDKFQVAEVLVRKQGVVYDIVAAINIFRSLIVCAVFDVHMLSSFQCDTINNTSIHMCVCVYVVAPAASSQNEHLQQSADHIRMLTDDYLLTSKNSKFL